MPNRRTKSSIPDRSKSLSKSTTNLNDTNCRNKKQVESANRIYHTNLSSITNKNVSKSTSNIHAHAAVAPYNETVVNFILNTTKKPSTESSGIAQHRQESAEANARPKQSKIAAQFQNLPPVQSKQTQAKGSENKAINPSTVAGDTQQNYNSGHAPKASVRPRNQGREAKSKTVGDKISKSKFEQSSARTHFSSDTSRRNDKKTMTECYESYDLMLSRSYEVPSRVKDRLWLRVAYKNSLKTDEHPSKQDYSKGGNWLIFLNNTVADEEGLTAHDRGWIKVWKMVNQGILSYASCSTAVENADAMKIETGVINVYTKDFNDIKDVENIARKLAANLKLRNTMLYKPRKFAGKYKTDGDRDIAIYKFAFNELYVKNEQRDFVTQDGKLYGPPKKGPK